MTKQKFYDIQGRVVEESKSKNYYRIIGDLRASGGYSENPSNTFSYQYCFQLNIHDGKPNHIKLGDIVTMKNAQLSIRDEHGKDLDPEGQTDMIISIDTHNGITVHVANDSFEHNKAYLNRPYKAIAWSGMQNTVHIEGLVVDKFLSNGIIRVMTQSNTMHANPSFVCFDIHMSRSVYDFHAKELDKIEVGDMLMVKGALFYINNSFKHTDYTHDYTRDKKFGKKIIVNIQASQVIKMPPGDQKNAGLCIQEYLSDKFRIGNYGDNHGVTWPKDY